LGKRGKTPNPNGSTDQGCGFYGGVRHTLVRAKKRGMKTYDATYYGSSQGRFVNGWFNNFLCDDKHEGRRLFLMGGGGEKGSLTEIPWLTAREHALIMMEWTKTI